MKLTFKSCLTACLLSAAIQANASQIPCPSADFVTSNAGKIDTVQYIGWSHFAALTGTDVLKSSYYDDESNRYWRLISVIGIEDQGLFNSAYEQARKLMQEVTGNVERYASEEDGQDSGKVYVCTYTRNNEQVKVMAFSPLDNTAPNSQFLKALIKRA